MVNYKNILENFWEVNSKEKLGGTVALLYFFLLKLSNENYQRFFSYSDVQICEEIGITRPTIKVVREKLKKAGLITYQTKRFHSCEYKIIIPKLNNEFFYSNKISKTNEGDNSKSEDNINTDFSEPTVDELINAKDVNSDNIIPEETPEVISEIINENEESPELDDGDSSKLESSIANVNYSNKHEEENKQYPPHEIKDEEKKGSYHKETEKTVKLHISLTYGDSGIM